MKNRSSEIYDAIIVGAGPGGVQAAIYLGRYNFKVLLLDRGAGGRTRHAVHVENYLGYRAISGGGLLDIGLEQARSFGVEVKNEKVTGIAKDQTITVRTADASYTGRFVIVSTGVRDNSRKWRTSAGTSAGASIPAWTATATAPRGRSSSSSATPSPPCAWPSP